MADSYSKWVMTTAFANNSQAALNSGGKIEWVSLKTSDDAHQVSDLDGFNDTTLATANIKQISGISSVTISGNTVTITGLFNSTNNASDYYIRTIFLVAKYNGKEFLAGTTVANTSGSAFRMPASSDTEITEFTARPQISVTNTNSISTTVDPVASATNERVDSLEATLQGEIDDINVDKQNLWNKLADYVTKAAAETITGVKTFSQTIVGSITGNAGTATKLQTERTIGFSGDVNGTAQGFDGSKNITLPINLNSINQNNTTSTQSAGYNSPVTIIDGITRDTKGRVTGVNTKTVTLPPVQTTISGNAASATKLETARLIGGVYFDGTSDIILPGVNSIGNQNTTGNAATATNADIASKAVALQTPRKINGTAFDGTADINVNAANDSNLVHTTGDETVGGNKAFTNEITFNKAINGALKVRAATFTDFATIAQNMVLYGGLWKIDGTQISNSPTDGSNWYQVEVQSGDWEKAGVIKLFDRVNRVFYYSVVADGSLSSWGKVAKDETVLHLSGDETAAGFKKFSGNIATTSDNSMINGGGNNGDIALVKKNGGSGFLAIGSAQLGNTFRIKRSNNASIDPSDNFNDLFTVDINGIVKAGTQQDLVPLDKNVVHNSGSETVGGDKNFTGNNRFLNPIYGSLVTKGDTFTKFSDVAQNLPKYAGYHASGTGYITDMPYPGWAVIHVQPYGSNLKTGIITLIYTDSGVTIRGHVNDGSIYWEFSANDARVVHNTGNEDIYGMKNFANGATVKEGFELFNNTPYIDFHFNNDTSDFTSRIIETAKGTLSINGVNMSGGAISGTLNGNASSATKLQTSRNINGVGFDGTYDITVDPIVRQIDTATDLFALPNGFYCNNGVASTNKPEAASNYFVVEVIQTSTNGFMRLIDSNGLSFWTTKSASAWGAWHQDADDSTVVHKTGDETIGGNNTFTGNNTLNGVTTVNSAKSSSPINKTITTSLPTSLQFTETAFGVMVYGGGYGSFHADGIWKSLGTLPAGITPPSQIVIMSDVDWAGVGGVTYRLGVSMKISINPTGEINYKCASLKDNDNTTYDVQTGFDLSTYWSK